MASNGEVGGKLERLQYHLEGFIENLRTVGVIAGNFQQNGQNNFNEKLNGLVDNMRYLSRTKDEYADVQIPLSVLEYIDSGQNPELFTRNQLKQTLEDHQAVQKKVQAYKDFRTQLIKQLEPIFREEIQAYLASSQQNHEHRN